MPNKPSLPNNPSDNRLYPSYLNAFQNGRLRKAINGTFDSLKACVLCPRKCGVNRIEEKKGFCKTGRLAKVYSYFAHQGEEPPISGKNGSGTIFFSGCNMACVYCQNFEFSQIDKGNLKTEAELSEIMLSLQNEGCHNINLVTPTHVLPQILKALELAIPKGLKIPLVYNTGGFELAEIIKLLYGIIDIYLPDMRYSDETVALKYSNASHYPEFNRDAILEMHAQAGIPEFNADGTIKKGLIIRHLVLPNNIAGTEKTIEFIAKNLSQDSYISLMSQYMPLNKTGQFKELSRRITKEEYKTAQETMEKYGLSNGWTQEEYGLDTLAGINIKKKD